MKKDPAHDVTVDVDVSTVTFNGLTVLVTLPEGTRTAGAPVDEGRRRPTSRTRDAAHVSSHDGHHEPP